MLVGTFAQLGLGRVGLGPLASGRSRYESGGAALDARVRSLGEPGRAR